MQVSRESFLSCSDRNRLRVYSICLWVRQFLMVRSFYTVGNLALVCNKAWPVKLLRYFIRVLSGGGGGGGGGETRVCSHPRRHVSPPK